MPRFVSFCLCSVLLVASQATGRTEYILGGVDGVPWQEILSPGTAGAYLVLDEGGRLVSTVTINTVPQQASADTLIDFSGSSIQPISIDPMVNLTRGEPDNPDDINKVFLTYTGGEVSVTYGCRDSAQNAPFNWFMLDGKPTTAQFRDFTQHPDRVLGIPFGNAFRQAIIFDLGANVPINRIRFYPRLGREEDALLIQSFADPKPSPERFGEDSFADNFVAWFEIRVGDNSLPYQNGPCGRVPDRRWVSNDDPLLDVLYSTRENLKVVTDLRFSTRSTRYLYLRVFPLRNWEISEFEVYGEGYVEESTLLSQILDFGKPINWGKIRWRGEAPEGSRVEIRTRTGHTSDPNLYFAPNANGDLSQISLGEYLKIDALSRLPTVYDAKSWSFWSPPYDFQAGLQDASHPPDAWEDGTPLLSPGPSRYLQIAIKLFSAPFTPPRLDQLSLQFGEVPSAQEIFGEIWPIEVHAFTPTTFTYVISPHFQADDGGFDRLEIFTHIRADTIRSVVLDGVAVDHALFPPQILDDRILVAFPRMGEEEDSFKQLEVVFDAPVLRFGAEFSSWVFNSEDPDRIRQQVKPGNATFRFSGDVLAVKTPVGGDLLVDVKVAPNPFTPNGDGINDLLGFSYKLREVTVDRPISLHIYDLAGRLVAALPPLPSRSGKFRQEWDGRDAGGQRVPPGTYLYKLALEVEDEQHKMGFFLVAY